MSGIYNLLEWHIKAFSKLSNKSTLSQPYLRSAPWSWTLRSSARKWPWQNPTVLWHPERMLLSAWCKCCTSVSLDIMRYHEYIFPTGCFYTCAMLPNSSVSENKVNWHSFRAFDIFQTLPNPPIASVALSLPWQNGKIFANPVHHHLWSQYESVLVIVCHCDIGKSANHGSLRIYKEEQTAKQAGGSSSDRNNDWQGIQTSLTTT